MPALNIRLTNAQSKQLKAEAKRNGMPVSRYVRRSLGLESGPPGSHPSPEPAAEPPAGTSELVSPKQGDGGGLSAEQWDREVLRRHYSLGMTQKAARAEVRRIHGDRPVE
jgi:hypothetical protein